MSNVKRNRPAYSGRVFCALTATALMGAIAISASSIPALAQDVQTGQITVIADQDDGQASAGNSAGGTSGGISQESKDAAVVISSEDLDLSGPTDLQDVFSQETSVSVGGSMPTAQKLYVHGLEENNLNIQIDGARQTNNLWHHNGGTLIDPSLLKAVEVNPGVAPADAGAGALGGSVRYETKDAGDLLNPGQNLGAYIYGAYDTNSETFTKSGSVYGRSNGFEILVFGSLADGEDYEDGSGATINATAMDFTSALGKVAYEASTGDRFELSTDYASDEGLRPYRSNFAGFSFPSTLFWPDTFTEFSRQTTNFSYTSTKPTALYDPEINVYYNEAKLNRRDQFDTKIESTGGKVQNTFSNASGRITVGADYYNDKSNNLPEGGISSSEEVSNLGLYAQARLEHMNKLRLSFGIRGDFQRFESVGGTEIETQGASPNASVEFDVFDNFTLLASTAHTFGGIKLTEVGLLSAATGYASDIKPEWADSFRFGGQYKNDGWTLEAYYFDTTIEDVVNPFSAVARTNIGDLTSKGVDVAARYNWDNAYLSFKYSHVDVKLNDEPVTTLNFFVGTPVGDVFTLAGAYSWTELGLTIGFSSEFVTDFDEIVGVAGGPPPAQASFGTLEGYSVVDVFTEWTPKTLEQLTLRAEVNNVFDELYADRATSVGLSAVEPLNEAGRSAKLSGKWTF